MKQDHNGPMRLLVVTRENAQDKAYGLGKTLTPILQQLEEKGHQIDYFDKTKSQRQHEYWQPRIQRILAPFIRGLSHGITERLVQGVAAATRAIASHASHVWVHDPWLVLGLRIGLLRRGYLRRPFKLIVSEHGLGSFAWAVTQDGLPIKGAAYRRMLSLERRLLQNADAVFTPSQSALNALLRDLGFSSQPPHFCVMGYGRPQLDLPSKNAALRHLGLPVGSLKLPVVLAIGRIAPVKNFPLLIHALAHLQHHYNCQTQLVIAGGGDAAPLKQLASRLQLSPSPIIGLQPDISWPLAAADIYVSTCPVESYGQANREALAAHLPTLAPAAGGSGEVLGQGAWLLPMSASVDCEQYRLDSECSVPQQEVQRLAAALHDLITRPELYCHWQQKAQKESEQWISWQGLANHYEHHLR